ncbi:MAG: hypothetical protein WCJ60_00620 [bacterium]
MTTTKTLNSRIGFALIAALFMMLIMSSGAFAVDKPKEDNKVAICEFKSSHDDEGEDEDKDAWCVAQRTVTPTAETFINATCDAKGSYTVPTSAGVEYLVGEEVVAAGTYSVTAPAKVTVTAQVEEGYFLDEEVATEWTHDYAAATNCQAVLGTSTTTTTATPQVTAKPVGAANAGGQGNVALIGLAGSSVILAAGALLRKFAL